MVGSVWLPLNASTVWHLCTIDSNLEPLALQEAGMSIIQQRVVLRRRSEMTKFVRME